MAKRRGRTRPDVRPAKQRLTDDERRAVGPAASAGLYVLFEGRPGHRTWRVYSRQSGRCLGWWRPHATHYFIGAEDGRADAFDAVLAVARGVVTA